MTGLFCVSVIAVGALGWIIRAIRAADRKVDDLIRRPADIQELPAWHTFLNPGAAHDQAVIDAMEQQFGEGR